jgi:hypothetical protein
MPNISVRSFAVLMVLSFVAGVILFLLGHPAFLLGHAVGTTVGVIQFAANWAKAIKAPTVPATTAKTEVTWSEV